MSGLCECSPPFLSISLGALTIIASVVGISDANRIAPMIAILTTFVGAMIP